MIFAISRILFCFESISAFQRRRFDLLEDFERDSFETLVKDLDKRHFHSSPYNCEMGGVFNYHGDLDYTERAYRMIRDFEDTMQQFSKKIIKNAFLIFHF